MRARNLQSSPIHSARFSKSESPSYINGGEGWTEASARAFLDDHQIEPGRVTIDGDSIRVRAKSAGEHLKNPVASSDGVPLGVVVIRCTN